MQEIPFGSNASLPTSRKIKKLKSIQIKNKKKKHKLKSNPTHSSAQITTRPHLHWCYLLSCTSLTRIHILVGHMIKHPTPMAILQTTTPTTTMVVSSKISLPATPTTSMVTTTSMFQPQTHHPNPPPFNQFFSITINLTNTMLRIQRRSRPHSCRKDHNNGGDDQGVRD